MVDNTSNLAVMVRTQLRLPSLRDFTDAFILATKILWRKEKLEKIIKLFIRALYNRAVYEEMLSIALHPDLRPVIAHALKQVHEKEKDPRLHFLLNEIEKLPSSLFEVPKRIAEKKIKIHAATCFLIDDIEFFDSHYSHYVTRSGVHEDVLLYTSRTRGIFNRIDFEIEFVIYSLQLGTLFEKFDNYSGLFSKIRILSFVVKKLDRQISSDIVSLLRRLLNKAQKIATIGILSPNISEIPVEIIDKIPEKIPLTIDHDMTSFLYSLGAFLIHYSRKYLGKI